eukprot:g7652.t1
MKKAAQSSVFHMEVSKVLRDEGFKGVPLVNEDNTSRGLWVNICLTGHQVGIEVDGPSHFVAGSAKEAAEVQVRDVVQASAVAGDGLAGGLAAVLRMGCSQTGRESAVLEAKAARDTELRTWLGPKVTVGRRAFWMMSHETGAALDKDKDKEKEKERKRKKEREKEKEKEKERERERKKEKEKEKEGLSEEPAKLRKKSSEARYDSAAAWGRLRVAGHRLK